MKYMTKDELIAFEARTAEYWEAGDLPYLIHLSGGNEDFLIELFDQKVNEGDWVFSSHRNHYHALLSGVNPQKLEKAILDGNSMFVYDYERKFLTSSILAGTCAMAVGVAWALKEEKSQNQVWCFLGDGAEEEGHLYEAVMMVSGHNLPCTFVIEDNNRSVDSTLEERLPTRFRLNWPSCVIRNKYVSTFPHAGNGTKKIIEFKPLKSV